MKDGTHDKDTVEIPIEAVAPREPWPQSDTAQVQVDVAALSHPGLVRDNNEDHYLVLRFGRTLETLLTNLAADQLPARSDEVGYCLVVADGIGGAAAGELASQMAITTLVSLILNTPDWILSSDEPGIRQVIGRMAERYRRIQAALRYQGSGDPELAGMGTTMTLACSMGARLVLGHIGDSRAYLFRRGELCQLTRDHTLVQSMIDQGQLTAEQAATHPWRHVLTRSLGAAGDNFEGDFDSAWLADGDQLLLCTDGLTDMVDSAGIASVLREAASSKDGCQALVDAALNNGGQDNVTVVLARYGLPEKKG
jgi:protein phosphatase